MGEASCQITAGWSLIRPRDAALDKFVDLMQSPFKQQFTTHAFLASLGSSLGISLLVLAAFCVLRPYNSLVYAPKLRYADEKRAPPAIDKGYFSWTQPLIKCHEADLMDKIGMDATIFLRFMRLCRTLFFYLSILGCVIMIPVNVSCNLKSAHFQSINWNLEQSWYVLMTPTFTWGRCMWTHVVMSYVFTLLICWVLWRNYREVVALKRTYFESQEYADSLYSRTLMIWHLPSSYRSDAGLNKLITSLPVPTEGTEKYSIGRNVRELPSLMEEHERATKKLEKALSKYLKNPERLPPTRPTCKPDKHDKSMDKNTRVDTIEYYKHRIEALERQVAISRGGVDKRNATSYGFVSYPSMARAHITAKAVRGKHPKGTSIQLATKPEDIIWANLTKSKATRRWNGFVGNVLFFLLSVLFVIPNALIAVFLSNLNNITLIWPSFSYYLIRDAEFYAVVQGFLAPTVTSIIYLLLPVAMRRLCAWQGDITKSSRERHVTHMLYVFFIINNFIMFTLFGTLWTTVSEFINISQKDGVNWDSIKQLHFGDKTAIAIFDISVFWITYLLQRNMGALLDLAQLFSLVGKSFTIRFLSPTPRQKIEWTAPPTFEFATYYNYFLFYVTIALCFATIQPLVLPVAFLYFLVDNFLKKYSLMYIFVTKVESGGTFWRFIFNRLLFATGFFNCVVSLVVWSRYDGQTASSVLPNLFILIFFKVYCHRTFDADTRFYTRPSERDSILASSIVNRKDRLDMRYSHPAIHRKLMRPMVHGNAEHLMAEIFGHKAAEQEDGHGGIGMQSMQRGVIGKKAPTAGFEIVQEEDMDFANFKDRAEFGEEHGGGVIYGNEDMMGMMTPPPGLGSPASSRPGSPVLGATGPLGYRGAEYFPVTGPPPPRSPGLTGGFPAGNFSQQSFHRPESPFDWSHTDSRSESESVTHLMHQQGPHSHYHHQNLPDHHDGREHR